MIGHPKFKEGDTVYFKLYGNEVQGVFEVQGVVEVVDAYGTLEDDTEVSYNVYVAETRTLYKHLSERSVYQKS